jgi:hypothetical protein
VGSSQSNTLPSNAIELGIGLRGLRGRHGLRKLEARQDRDPKFRYTISKSQLQRYERGDLLPPLAHAEHLDSLYDGQGWVDISLRSLWRTRWDPWGTTDRPSRHHAVEWPAKLAGIVWLKVIPVQRGAESDHHIELVWGPWSQTIDIAIEARGAVLFTGKAEDEDGMPVTCNVSADRPVHLLHGAGDDFVDDIALDVRSGWRRT